jgi:NAD(P)H-dependent FMN reductase
LLISGSTRGASTNTAALRTARQVAPDGVTTVLFEGLADLPAFNPDLEQEPPHPTVRDLRTRLAEADVVLFCTPEYAGALPGSFKNLIDWTVGNGDLYRKPAAWINVAAEGRGGGALAELTTVLGYVAATVIEAGCVRLHVDRAAVGPDGTVIDEEFRIGIADVLSTIAQHYRKLADSANAERLR